MRFNQHCQEPTEQDIYDLFARFAYERSSLITHQNLCHILHTQSKKIFNCKFDESIIEEIWGQAETTSKGETSVSTIVDIIIEALDILSQRISDIEGCGEDHGLLVGKKKQVEEKRKDLEEHQLYYEDSDYEINKIRRELVQLEFEQNELENDLEMFTSEYKTLCRIFTQIPSNLINTQTISINNDSKLNPYNSTFTYQKQSQQVQLKKSKALLYIFHLTNVLFVLQLVIMTYRFSFLPILVYLHSYYIIFMGFQTNNSLILVIVTGLSSMISDVSYVVLRIINQIQLMPFIHESNIIFAIICFTILGISVIIRGILFGFYFRYLNKENLNSRDYIVVFGHQIFLNHGDYFLNFRVEEQDRQKISAYSSKNFADYQ